MIQAAGRDNLPKSTQPDSQLSFSNITDISHLAEGGTVEESGVTRVLSSSSVFGSSCLPSFCTAKRHTKSSIPTRRNRHLQSASWAIEVHQTGIANSNDSLSHEFSLPFLLSLQKHFKLYTALNPAPAPSLRRFLPTQRSRSQISRKSLRSCDSLLGTFSCRP